MLIAHISDFHIFSNEAETSIVRPDVAACVEKIVADIKAFSPKIEAVMLTGDVADGGSDEDYALVKSLLAPLDMPVYPIPGNHDDREGFRRAFAGEFAISPAGPVNYEARQGDLRILALDSLIEGRVEGELTPATLDWLEARLAEDFIGHTYLLIHHPPFKSGIEGLDVMSLINGGERLGTLVANYHGEMTVLAGHIHRAYQAIWQGKLCAVGGSPAFEIDLDLHEKAPAPPLVDNGYGYFIHRRVAGAYSILRREVTL